MIREKKLKVTNEITNVMEYYNSSFLQAVPNLMLEYKRLAKEQGIELQQPKPITMGMWIGGRPGWESFCNRRDLEAISNDSKWSHSELLYSENL